jgi:hypothetical protein
MATLAVTNTFSAGTTIVAADVNQNNDDIEAFVNTTPGVVQNDIVDVLGDLIVASGADAVSRLAAGTNNHVLTADSAISAHGLKWAAAPTPTDITVADTTDTTCFVGLWESATGDLAPKTDTGITYNAGTGMLSATGLTGPLTGNVTGNVTGNASGTALTVTQAAQSAITSVGALTGLTVGSDGSGGDVTFHSGTAGDAFAWDSSEEKLTITGTDGQTALDVPDGNVTITDTLTVSGGLVAPLAINAQSGTTYTFVLADAGKFVSSSNGSAQTFTVPPNSSVAYDTGTQIIVQNIGSANCTLAQGSGVTINSKDSNKEIDGQYAAATLIKTATDAWSLIGALA